MATGDEAQYSLHFLRGITGLSFLQYILSSIFWLCICGSSVLGLVWIGRSLPSERKDKRNLGKSRFAVQFIWWSEQFIAEMVCMVNIHYYYTHCIFLNIYISQKIRICVVDIEGQF